jgi:DNA-binding CsgD family transcriptional regulator
VTLPNHSTLTRRESQVLRQVLAGRTAREIAHEYGIGHQTVKNYLTVIYEKLGVTGRRQLAVPSSSQLSSSTCPASPET